MEETPVLQSFQGWLSNLHWMNWIGLWPHLNCRSPFYPRTQDSVSRFPVPDDAVSWDVPLDYHPTNYTDPKIQGAVWADKELGEGSFQWNQVDGKINRKSFTGPYKLDKEGYPVNPMGRTGIKGRGVLGKWGPNHAADPIVTRWKREGAERVVHPESGKPILEFVSIERRDCGAWALPGGMVDAGEEVSETLKREFGEETLNSLTLSPAERTKLEETLRAFFHHGVRIYNGYVDDPRNTDNAWMETVAMNFHDDKGDAVGRFDLQIGSLKAGDDAVKVHWMAVEGSLKLYASHSQFIQAVCKLHHAHY